MATRQLDYKDDKKNYIYAILVLQLFNAYSS